MGSNSITPTTPIFAMVLIFLCYVIDNFPYMYFALVVQGNKLSSIGSVSNNVGFDFENSIQFSLPLLAPYNPIEFMFHVYLKKLSTIPPPSPTPHSILHTFVSFFIAYFDEGEVQFIVLNVTIYCVRGRD